MSATDRLLYFDSCVIIRYLENGDGAHEVDRLLNLAMTDQARIVVSTNTILEVTRERYKPVDLTKMAKVKAFFENPYIHVVDFYLQIAHEAFDLIYDYPWLHPKDAGHLATAIARKCQAFFTYDGELLRKFDGERELRVIEPGQMFGSAFEDLTGLPIFDQIPESLGGEQDA